MSDSNKTYLFGVIRSVIASMPRDEVPPYQDGLSIVFPVFDDSVDEAEAMAPFVEAMNAWAEHTMFWFGFQHAQKVNNIVNSLASVYRTGRISEWKPTYRFVYEPTCTATVPSNPEETYSPVCECSQCNPVTTAWA